VFLTTFLMTVGGYYDFWTTGLKNTSHKSSKTLYFEVFTDITKLRRYIFRENRAESWVM